MEKNEIIVEDFQLAALTIIGVASLIPIINTIRNSSSKGSLTRASQKDEYLYPMFASDDLDKDVVLQIRKMSEKLYAKMVLNVVDKVIYSGYNFNGHTVRKSVTGGTEHNVNNAFDLGMVLTDLLKPLTLMEDATPNIHDKMKQAYATIVEGDDRYAHNSAYATEEEIIMEAVDTSMVTPEGTTVDTVAKVRNTNQEIKAVPLNLLVKVPLYGRTYTEFESLLGSTSPVKQISLKDKWFKFKNNKEAKFLKDFLFDLKSLKSTASKAKIQEKKLDNFISEFQTKHEFPYVSYVISSELFAHLKEANNVQNDQDIFKVMSKIAGMALFVVDYNSVEMYMDGGTKLTYMLTELTSETDKLNKELADVIKRQRVQY